MPLKHFLQTKIFKQFTYYPSWATFTEISLSRYVLAIYVMNIFLGRAPNLSNPPDIPQASRVGATPGGAAGRGGVGQDGAPTERSAQETTDPFAPQAS